MVLYLGLSGLGFGLMRPGLMAGASLSVGRAHQGAAGGAMNATAAIGHVINPFTGAVLYQHYEAGPFLTVSVCMVVFLALALFHPGIKRIGTKSVEEDDHIPAPHEPIGTHAR
jgi:MFS family permease